jgi:plastocyanin
MRRLTAVVGVAALAMTAAGWLLPGTAGAATVRVAIEATGFDPAVLVVPPGTTVEWRNDDAVPRALAGDVASPEIAPAGTFRRRFPRLGRFDYRDRANAALTGTVVVAAYVRRPRHPPPPGPPGRVVTHRWRATLRVDLVERWKYLDGKFLTFEGPCNAEVGDGSREVTFRATLPDVRYTRLGSLEILRGESPRHGIARYRETIDAMASDPSSGRTITCPDGSGDPPPDVEHTCRHDRAGTRVTASLSWAPRIGQGRMFWAHAYAGRRPPSDANCGDSFLGAGSLVGLDADALPFDPGAGNELLYDAGRTSPLTVAEVRALRAGRALTVTRGIGLRFTTDCCSGWTEPGKPTTYVRVGARFDVAGRVTIRLTPR